MGKDNIGILLDDFPDEWYNEKLHVLMDVHYHKGVILPNGQASRYRYYCRKSPFLEPLWKMNENFLDSGSFVFVAKQLEVEIPEMWKGYCIWCLIQTKGNKGWADDLLNALKKIYDLKNLVRFIMLPENKVFRRTRWPEAGL
jgi:hypothetical protein